MGETTPSVSDIRAVMDASNGSNGFAYPVFANGNNGFGGESGWIWLIVILALLGGFNGNGFGGGYGNNDFAWLSNGQKEIMQNTNNGFDTLHLSNQIEGVRDGVAGLSNQICNSFADAESNDNARHIADMQQAFSNQLSTVQGFNGISSDLARCCCENRLGIADLKATVLAENCADREALREVGQSILVNQNENTQKIIDEIFRDRLDEKDSKIADLQRELQMADLRASQIAQTQAITSNIYNELKNCPVGTVPVYGSQPIFTCPGNSGCGCGTYGTTLV